MLILHVFASVCIGCGLGLLVWTVLEMLRSEELEQDLQWRYDVSRVNELRRISFLYRFFHPLMQLFARLNRVAFRDSLPEIRREIHAAGLPRFWTGAEYLARMQLIALLLFPLFAYFCVSIMGPAGIVLALSLSFISLYILRRRLTNAARYRLLLVKRRLPFLLDLMTLLMEAGSTFLQALSEGVAEYREHPVGVEFGRVLAEMSMGKTRTEAFESMRARLEDDEITAIIGAIVQGEILGTPLATLFRTQADVLRIKRTQRAETLANEAGVKMLGPTVMVMAATVIIILGPFILGFIYADVFL